MLFENLNMYLQIIQLLLTKLPRYFGDTSGPGLRNISSAICPGGGDESYLGYEIPQHKQKLEVRQPFIPGFLHSFLPLVTFS
jgi:hypothetical protein